MRIGVYSQESVPERGGSYTFESQILESFLMLATQSKHQFSMLGADSSHLSKVNQNVNFVDGSQSNSKLIKDFFNPSFLESIKHTFPWLEETSIRAKSKAHGRLAKQLRLHLIWSIVPGSYTQEIPYITPIFDLQHRLQPFFPEVGNKEEWQRRESTTRPLVSRAAIIVTGTQVGKSEIELFYNISSDKIRVVPFPTPTFATQRRDLESSKTLQKYDLPSRYIFYPAQFWPHKNHANLLLAIAYLKRRFELTVPAVFVGSDKGNLAYLKTLIEQHDLSSQIKLLGFVPQADLAALYQKATALAFVSFFGPDNLPPLEAFALSCPVIAADVPGAREQLGDAAKLVNPKDVEQIALAIKDFWENVDSRQEYIQRGKLRANQWSAQDYVRQIFEIFDELEPVLNCWQA